ncbi:hypothetical protein Bca52824_083341 [Brassica carinata]|uniref:Uncharacterized protein n=1 Tax=Brassica carinata TaxID=52824 RepID=A0A8X7PKL8_BRACI|nr:hypothetical protein Bca52824_083341 [Brassica carinata]
MIQLGLDLHKQFPPPRHVEKKDKGSIEEESEDEWVEVDSDEDLEDMDEDDEEEGSGKDMDEDDDIDFMEAKSHCKVHYGDGGDEEDAELEEFYDYSSSSTLSNPAIAIAAALSLAVEVSNFSDFDGSSADAVAFLEKKLDYLVSSRPTAVNLADAALKLNYSKCLGYFLPLNLTPFSRNGCFLLDDSFVFLIVHFTTYAFILQAYIEAVENMLEDDVASNKAIGTFGSSLMRQQAKNPDKLSVLTHCNTGRYDFR